MSINGALSNAVLGLRAAGRGAEIVSSNLANALTPGYGRRVLALSSQVIGDSGGVKVDGIVRVVDAGLASDKRLAGAEFAKADATAGFLSRFEEMLGTPDEPASLSARMADFAASLIAAESRPEATERLATAVAEARGLAEGIKAASDDVQEQRSLADQRIGSMVNELNLALEQVVTLNKQITRLQVQGGSPAALQDQRQQLVERISELVPVREVPRDNGQIALYTTGGAILLDGTAAELGFEPVHMVTPYMSVGGGTLSGLTINGQPVRIDSEKGALRGGAIGAQFAIRDELGVEAQEQLDLMARDLIERFEDPAVDPTLTAGAAGLFTDNGNPLDPLDTVGLANRLAVNAAVDPLQGGESWRMRDGIGATVQGNVGDARLLQALSDTLTTARPLAGGQYGGSPFSATNLIATVASNVGAQRNNAEQMLSFASARLTELTERQLADGVNSDAEIQRLMLVEQAYVANAKVIETVDELMQTILRI